MFKKDDVIQDDVETVIGPSVQVEGDFNAAGDVIVEGTVTGSLKTERHLKVGQDAKIFANVAAGSAFVAGEIHGNLKVKDTLELVASAKIYGDIKTKVLNMESGASFFGKCQAGEDKKKAEKATKAKEEGKKESKKEENGNKGKK